ncbi:hypothetical protein ERX46_15880 [Brumimicrobium glaciale]|uniref:Uncharacterized protein n=1 Tax=Brumimicrobium glaciale TaxID=200475 RepID=A0A4Q4KHC5_9FLAO|nr:hypothetical protein [Brumimicrobium glaciale]RYM32160.1 hypothetical protein ERX46_15880 [Brumimicrobium glaciale]
MKTLKIITSLVGLLMISTLSIAQTESKDNLNGTYGEAFIHQLILNEDQTFHYIRVINDKKTDVTGKWSVIDEEINLIDSSNDKKVLTKWKVKNNTSCLKSKKGLATYTLCKKCE